MDNELFDDLMLSLNQALAYVKGDQTQARSEIVTISDEESDRNETFIQIFYNLTEPNKQKVMQYTSELLQASAN